MSGRIHSLARAVVAGIIGEIIAGFLLRTGNFLFQHLLKQILVRRKMNGFSEPSGQMNGIGKRDGPQTVLTVRYQGLTMQQVSDRFITDGTDQDIRLPYGIAVNPITKDVYVTDARDYVTPGRLYCYGPDGVKKWDVLTGYIPAHFTFVGENLNEN